VLPDGAGLDAAAFERLLALRESVSKVLEPMRAGGAIGAALEAEVDLYLDPGTLAILAACAGELRFLFIVSELRLHPLAEKPGDAVKADGIEAWIVARATSQAKCIRCWHYRADVGSHPEHPEICGRCVSNVEGQGETRQWF
jgi:isoleucyl-tRNA synthetase